MMKRLLLGLGLGLALLVMGVSLSFAQSNTRICVQSGDNCVPVDSSAPLPIYTPSNSFVSISTSTDTNVKGSAGTFVGFSVSVAGGAGSTLAIYNDADGTCNSGLIGTFPTTSTYPLILNVAASVGICAQTAGVTPATLTVLYR